jgi:hypothetical protein
MRQFSLRDLVWLTALVGLGAGWVADHRRQELRLAEQRAANVEAAAKVQIEWLKRYRGEIVD